MAPPKAAEDCVRSACPRVALVVVDWSQLHYLRHTFKLDRDTLTIQNDKGHEFRTALLLSDPDSTPSPTFNQSLRFADGDTQFDVLLPLFRLAGGLGRMLHDVLFGKVRLPSPPPKHAVDTNATSGSGFE